jgi:hypothetical protein
VIGGWRKLCSEELRNFYSSPNNIKIIILKEDEMGNVACIGKMRDVYKILAEKSEVNREVGWKGVDWIHVAQDRDWWQALVNAVCVFHKMRAIS